MRDKTLEMRILGIYDRTIGKGMDISLREIARMAGTSHGNVRAALVGNRRPYRTRKQGPRLPGSPAKPEPKEAPAPLPVIHGALDDKWTAHRATGDEVRRARLREIYNAPGAGPKHQRPGAGYAPGYVLLTACRACGARIVICPQTYGHFIRCKDGTIAWLCAPCDGSLPRGTQVATFLNER